MVGRQEGEAIAVTGCNSYIVTISFIYFLSPVPASFSCHALPWNAVHLISASFMFYCCLLHQTRSSDMEGIVSISFTMESPMPTGLQE